MGLRSSKHIPPEPSSLSSSSSCGAPFRKSRSSRSRLFKSSSFRSHCSDNGDPQVSDSASEENGNPASYPCENKSRCVKVSAERYKLSGRAYPAASTSFRISNDEEECVIPSSSLVHRNNKPQGCGFFPTCFSNRSARTQHGNCTSNNMQLSPTTYDISDHLQDNRHLSSNLVCSREDTEVDCTLNLFSPANHVNSDVSGIRRVDRHTDPREPSEQNVQFSRTLSVGRLRDRVLRRSPVPDIDLYRFYQDGEVRRTGNVSRRLDLSHADFSRSVSSDNGPSSISNLLYGSNSHDYETPRARETRYRDLLEHRSNFLERRRRIRSQVRALQRLGSRFESFSDHERSCSSLGLHRSGHCTCHITRDVNSTDDAAATGSTSRIVMLAEALFEVLDEIHQQSVILSSRISLSSIGSVPAPNELVESLPLKIFGNLERKSSEEAAQCYICLVEYEEGERMRILPCHHEFHAACIDKWLKEIHRVCPLCRGDICKPDSSSAGS